MLESEFFAKFENTFSKFTNNGLHYRSFTSHFSDIMKAANFLDHAPPTATII